MRKQAAMSIKLEHNQFVSTNRTNSVELQVTMEAFETEHKEQIFHALADAGLSPEIVDTKLY